MSGDDDDESLVDFFESLLFEFERAIYFTTVTFYFRKKKSFQNKTKQEKNFGRQITKKKNTNDESVTHLNIFHDRGFF